MVNIECHYKWIDYIVSFNKWLTMIGIYSVNEFVYLGF